MWELFKEYPDALEHTVEIAEKCDLTLSMNEVLLPSFPLPDGVQSLNDYLEHLTMDGAQRIFGSIPDEVRDRISYELKVMNNLGLEGYFLIVQDFIQEARRRGIPMGPGRGSAAGSMVCYCPVSYTHLRAHET